MDDDFFFWMMIIGILAPVLRLIWWFNVLRTFKQMTQAFEQQLRTAESQGQQLQGTTGPQREQAMAQWLAQLNRVNSQYAALNNIRRQQYNVRMGELSGMAASNGLNWTPPS